MSVDLIGLTLVQKSQGMFLVFKIINIGFHKKSMICFHTHGGGCKSSGAISDCVFRISAQCEYFHL